MMIDEASYRQCFEGYRIADCAVRSSNIFYFVLIADDSLDAQPIDPDMEEDYSPSDGKRLTRVISCFLDDPIEKRWGYATYRGYEKLYAGASQRPLGQFIGVDLEGKVLAIGSGFKGFESPIPGSRQGPYVA